MIECVKLSLWYGWGSGLPELVILLKILYPKINVKGVNKYKINM